MVASESVRTTIFGTNFQHMYGFVTDASLRKVFVKAGYIPGVDHQLELDMLNFSDLARSASAIDLDEASIDFETVKVEQDFMAEQKFLPST